MVMLAHCVAGTESALATRRPTDGAQQQRAFLFRLEVAVKPGLFTLRPIVGVPQMNRAQVGMCLMRIALFCTSHRCNAATAAVRI